MFRRVCNVVTAVESCPEVSNTGVGRCGCLSSSEMVLMDSVILSVDDICGIGYFGKNWTVFEIRTFLVFGM